MSSRRQSLKIIGAIGTTCAFPFAADELYGQHTHPDPAPPPPAPAGPYTPRNFTAAEFAVIARVADLIIPPGDTPGASAAGVPRYIDEVVTANAPHKPRFQAGIAWLHDRNFLELDETAQVALLTPLCEAVDRNRIHSPAEIFFQLMKSMTADGYYTSRIGLVGELGYKGNTVLAAFPECTHPEHKS